ncbi:MAG: hypothetical protein KDD60_06315, partial [Bdellovibrionales bacterium]|nr:hypothetical protein [Bdellovibrionales bacterium]
MTQLNFSDCQYKGPSILEGKFADLGRVQPQNPLQPPFGPQPEGKVYTPEQKQAMDAALEEYGINYRGDPAGTRYVGGSPDFDETTGKFRTTPLPYYEQVERTLRMKIGNDKVDQLLGKLWHL